MERYSLSPIKLSKSILKNRELLKSLIIRDIKSKYTGSFIGVLWLVINPVIMLAIYTFVFSVVFNARWTATSESKVEFALVLFAGMMIFNIFSECISRASTLILQNTNLVKKVVFPLEFLVIVNLGSALFNFLISLIVWLVLYSAIYGELNTTLFFLPFYLIPYALFILGVSWFMCALGVYLRDLAQIINLSITVLLFMSPVFYPITALPEEFRSYLYINPMTYVIETFRDIVYFDIFSYENFFIPVILSIIVAWLGFIFFQKTRRGFSDVI